MAKAGDERKILDSYSIEPSLLAEVNKKAKRLRWSKAELIREALRRILLVPDEDLLGLPSTKSDKS